MRPGNRAAVGSGRWWPGRGWDALLWTGCAWESTGDVPKATRVPGSEILPGMQLHAGARAGRACPCRETNQREGSLRPRALNSRQPLSSPRPNPLPEKREEPTWKRLDFASLSSIFCLMSPGPIVGEESTSPRP